MEGTALHESILGAVNMLSKYMIIEGRNLNHEHHLFIFASVFRTLINQTLNLSVLFVLKLLSKVWVPLTEHWNTTK